MGRDTSAPAIGDYGLIGDGHTAALVSSTGSIDWACLPRLDSASVFGRLLDWDGGGHCLIAPADVSSTTRRYLPGSLVLETTFEAEHGTLLLTDLITMKRGGADDPHRQILRLVECVSGHVDVVVEVCPRLVYGSVRPWIREISRNAWACIGADVGLLVDTTLPLSVEQRHDLSLEMRMKEGDRHHLSIVYRPPERLDIHSPSPFGLDEADGRLAETLEWWHRWHTRRTDREPDDILRSAIVLKALNNPPTGAIAAAATTSLPEAPGGSRNWDYRFSWIRDAWLTVRSLHELGFGAEAAGFARFVARSAAGAGDEVQVMYGLGGERDLTEREIPTLSGYRGAQPVRVGNDAYRQHQLDIFGELLDVIWISRDTDDEIDDDLWEFIVEVVERARSEWSQPDRGMWEIRGKPRHFVFSKAMCWAALDRGMRLADHHGRSIPDQEWRQEADAIRSEVLNRGFSSRLRAFTQAIGEPHLDASTLLLPASGIIAAEDPRMVHTADAIMRGLDRDGLILRYSNRDGLTGTEGAFLPCTFWLAEVLAAQDRAELAHRYFDRARSTANDLGLLSEEWDVEGETALGNYPQAMTHLAHISAGLALEDMDRRLGTNERRPPAVGAAGEPDGRG